MEIKIYIDTCHFYVQENGEAARIDVITKKVENVTKDLESAVDQSKKEGEN